MLKLTTTTALLAILLAISSSLPAQEKGVQQDPATQQENAQAGNKTKEPAGGRAQGTLEVLTDTQGVDFGPYLSKVIQKIHKTWYYLIPPEARQPELKKGRVAIEFAILKNGQVAGMKISGPSGDIALDRAGWGGIKDSAPFAPLPEEFHGPYLALQLHFYYNLSKDELNNKSPSTTATPAKPPPH